MHQGVEANGWREPSRNCPAHIRTTLYDLICAIGQEVGDGDDGLVVAAVVDLMRNGRLKAVGLDECPQA